MLLQNVGTNGVYVLNILLGDCPLLLLSPKFLSGLEPSTLRKYKLFQVGCVQL